VPWLPGFLGELRGNYGSELQQVDFVKESEGARKAINAWTSAKTTAGSPICCPPGNWTPLPGWCWSTPSI